MSVRVVRERYDLIEVTHRYPAIVPVDSANLSPIADPTPLSTVVERCANRCDANGVFAREELDSDRLLRDILPHGDGLLALTVRNLKPFEVYDNNSIFLSEAPGSNRRTSSEPDLSLGN